MAQRGPLDQAGTRPQSQLRVPASEWDCWPWTLSPARLPRPHSAAGGVRSVSGPRPSMLTRLTGTLLGVRMSTLQTDPGTQSCLRMGLPWDYPSPSSSFCCLPWTSLGPPQLPGPPLILWVRTGPQAHRPRPLAPPPPLPGQGSPLLGFLGGLWGGRSDWAA